LLDKTTSLRIDQAYQQLRNTLLENKCKIIEESPPHYISVVQGSLNGILPKSAKKTVTYQLGSKNSGTEIAATTKIASSWTNLTLYGNILAAALAGIFLWIASDTESYNQAHGPVFWQWLAQIYSAASQEQGLFMINIIRAAAVFLILAIVAEILIVIYVYPRKDAFARETLRSIQ
jgi:hypothetical protein